MLSHSSGTFCKTDFILYTFSVKLLSIAAYRKFWFDWPIYFPVNLSSFRLEVLIPISLFSVTTKKHTVAIRCANYLFKKLRVTARFPSRHHRPLTLSKFYLRSFPSFSFSSSARNSIAMSTAPQQDLLTSTQPQAVVSNVLISVCSQLSSETLTLSSDPSVSTRDQPLASPAICFKPAFSSRGALRFGRH